MDNDNDTNIPGSPIFGFLGRLFAVAGAVTCCFLLYRFAKGAFANYRNPAGARRRRVRDRRGLIGRKGIAYERVGEEYEPFEDEDDDVSRYDAPLPIPKIILTEELDRPLPDKPLPPLPEEQIT